MRNPMRDRFGRFCLLLGFFIFPISLQAQEPPSAPKSLFDPRLDELKRASVAWANRRGPIREVIDQVVIVKDFPAYLEAIAEWDETRWYPILIEDACYTPRFLRAFRPARLVRPSLASDPIPASRVWEEALRAVKQARIAKSPKADLIEPDPPGIVLSFPESPSLAGAVALAAGRYQSLVRWTPTHTKERKLSFAQAWKIALDLEAAVSEVAPRFASFGDDCDFLTLAGPYPDRYILSGKGVILEGDAALDDLLARDHTNLRRWAYLGRLEGDAVASAYFAMSSLFLQPKSALLFDTYNPKDAVFGPYAMKFAEGQLPSEIAVTRLEGPRANLSEWHKAVSPENPFGLVFMNSRGSPSAFGANDRADGTFLDIPPSVPGIVLMNHSYSASDPLNPRTLAGAWMAGGTFLYFGSMNEPYINAFRTPELVASLLKEGLPIAAVVRTIPQEEPSFGSPWRLQLFGDPLFRLDPRAARQPRIPGNSLPAGYAIDQESPPPAASATEAIRLDWALQSALLDTASGRRSGMIDGVILGIRRSGLDGRRQAIWDGIVTNLLTQSEAKWEAAFSKLLAIPDRERSPEVTLAIDRFRVRRIEDAIINNRWEDAIAYWEALIQSGIELEITTIMTRVTGHFAETAKTTASWKSHLEKAIKARQDKPDASVYRDELLKLH